MPNSLLTIYSNATNNSRGPGFGSWTENEPNFDFPKTAHIPSALFTEFTSYSITGNRLTLTYPSITYSEKTVPQMIQQDDAAGGGVFDWNSFWNRRNNPTEDQFGAVPGITEFGQAWDSLARFDPQDASCYDGLLWQNWKDSAFNMDFLPGFDFSMVSIGVNYCDNPSASFLDSFYTEAQQPDFYLDRFNGETLQPVRVDADITYLPGAAMPTSPWVAFGFQGPAEQPYDGRPKSQITALLDDPTLTNLKPLISSTALAAVLSQGRDCRYE
jgi:hypothetical protein